jgi:predicted dehydrogenase
MTTAVVIGCGSIGTRHIKNLLDLNIGVIACDLDTDRLSQMTEKYGVETTSNYRSVINDVDCVLVCTPPAAHVPVAIDAIDAGADVFIEKPIAATADAAEPLVKREQNSEQLIYVACNMRFHPPVQYLDEILSNKRLGDIQFLRLRYGNSLENWRPGDYREYYSASSSKGGGIILDAIHEIDLANHWLRGTESVFCASKKLSDLDIDAEDTAELLLENKDALAEIHMDYLRPVRARTYEIIGSDGMARWHAEGKDPEKSRITVHDSTGELRQDRAYELSLNDMYIREIRHFLSCVEREDPPPVSAADGAQLVKLVELSKSASESGQVNWAGL